MVGPKVGEALHGREEDVGGEGGVAGEKRNASLAEIRLRLRGVSQGACAGGGDEDNGRGTWVGLARYVVVR